MRVICRWEDPFHESKRYWQKFCDDEERRLVKVRDPFPKSSHFPVVSNLRDSGLRDVVDLDALFASGSFDENVSLVDSASSSPRMPDIFREDDRPSVEPIVKIFPPTPLKTLAKDNAIAIVKPEEERASVAVENKSTTKKVILQRDSKSADASTKNSIMPHDGSGDRRMYSKGTCPFHRYEPAVKIFDDDIEKYLRDDPRASVSFKMEQKFNIELPLLKNVSKRNGIESKTISGTNQKIRRITFSRNKGYYPDKIVDSITTETKKRLRLKSKSGNKENKIPDQSRDIALKSDTRKSDLNFSLSRESTKSEKIVKDLKTAPFPKSLQSRVGAMLDRSITRSQKRTEVRKTQEKLANK